MKLPIGKAISSAEYDLRHTEAEVFFKDIMTSYNDESNKQALGDFEKIIVTPGWLTENLL